MHYRFAATAALSLIIAAACGADDGTDDESSGGSAGTGGSAGSTAGNGGALEAGSGGTGSEECAEDGAGSVELEVVGLPEGVDARITLEGGGVEPAEISGSQTFDGASSGSYTVTAERVTDSDPIVRTVYVPTVSAGSFCLEDGGEETVVVTYEAIPSSGKLWTSDLTGIPANELVESGTAESAVVVDASAGNDVAFDRDGNLWARGATTADPMLVRFSAGTLGTSGEKEHDRGIDLPIGCLPALRALSFDAAGNLWVVACGGEVQRVPAASLEESGDVEADVVLSEIEGASGLAFDADGNLWLAGADGILRYDADRLDASTSEAADLVIAPRDAGDSMGLQANTLAFDEEGNLWGFDFGGNIVFQLGAAELDGTGTSTVVSDVSIAIPVDVLLDRGAFDESGGLWISYSGNRVGRLSPEQLTVSSGTGSPTTPEVLVEQSELGTQLRTALFPAPAGLPLYHGLP